VKRILLVAIALATSLALTGAVVLRGGDRATLVPPPDAVAEQFVRQLAAHRFDRAVPFLSSHVRREIDARDLAAITSLFEAQNGAITFVEGQERSRTRIQAVAEVHTKTDRRQSPALEFELMSEHGEWKVNGLGPPFAPIAKEAR
jgi:hypothetical protein